MERAEQEQNGERRRAIVQEASCSERVIVLKVRVLGARDDEPKSVLVVVSGSAARPGVGLLSNEDRRTLWGGRLPAGIDRQRAREDALAHARLVAIGDREVFIDQHGSARVVRAERGRIVVTDGDAGRELTAFVALDRAARDDLGRHGLEIARAIAGDAIDARRRDVARVLEKADQRIRRRRDAIRGDLDRIGQADRIAAQAQWLVVEAGRAARGATKLVVTDWSTGEAVLLEVPLDPAKNAKDQVAAMFKRAKRLRLGGRIASSRLEQTDAQLAAVREASAAAADASTLAEIEDLLVRAKKAAPRDVIASASTSLPGASGPGASGQKKRASRERVPFRTFFARSGRKLLVGKGAADNDALTLKVGRPHDLWVHAKERTGAHVIVVLEKSQPSTSEELVDAAHLAAHFSDAREEKIVDVQYTDRRYLRKPKGSAPGLVVVDREKVLVLRMDAELLRSLLEREDL